MITCAFLRNIAAVCLVAYALPSAQASEATARLRLTNAASAKRPAKLPPAVLWLKPLSFAPPPFPAGPNPVMLQKNKMFSPHLVVVPVGGNVTFPNADPFFHNVFSLFDGKRFDLGLYEANSSRSVNFSREGISYIFCNIHPEMSAVVISLSTPYYGIAEAGGQFRLTGLPEGEYEMRVWVEGERQPTLDRYTRRIRIAAENINLGDIAIEHPQPTQHLNKFGQPYGPSDHEIY